MVRKSIHRSTYALCLRSEMFYLAELGPFCSFKNARFFLMFCVFFVCCLFKMLKSVCIIFFVILTTNLPNFGFLKIGARLFFKFSNQAFWMLFCVQNTYSACYKSIPKCFSCSSKIMCKESKQASISSFKIKYTKCLFAPGAKRHFVYFILKLPILACFDF